MSVFILFCLYYKFHQKSVHPRVILRVSSLELSMTGKIMQVYYLNTVIIFEFQRQYRPSGADEWITTRPLLWASSFDNLFPLCDLFFSPLHARVIGATQSGERRRLMTDSVCRVWYDYWRVFHKFQKTRTWHCSSCLLWRHMRMALMFIFWYITLDKIDHEYVTAITHSTNLEKYTQSISICRFILPGAIILVSFKGGIRCIIIWDLCWWMFNTYVTKPVVI